MYNRYIPEGTAYRRVVVDDGPGTGPSRPRSAPPGGQGTDRPRREPPGPGGGGQDPLSGLLGGAGRGLGSLLDALRLGDLDTGDLLLMLIVLLVLLEGDDLELVITLGLLLLMGLGDEGEGQPT